MKAENAIEVSEVTKSFKIFLDKGNTIKEKLIFRSRRRYEHRQVLKGVSFEVKKGEAIGLIGHNGCGKSTTLKLLTRIMYPDSGTIEMRGRISSLIELGAGFHPDMSGRENIYINAAIFGLTRAEIDQRLQDIIDFSELEEYIDNPVRTYSSGMYMRLAFAVAINVDADILLIDEILAVGDAAFQAKCFNKMREIKAAGTTIVLVSHAMGQVEQLCDRAIWIHEGLIRREGPTKDVTMEYLEFMNQERIRREEQQRSKEDHKPVMRVRQSTQRYGDQRAIISQVRIMDAEGNESGLFDTESPLTLEVSFTCSEKVENAQCGFGIFRIDGLWCYGSNTGIDHLEVFDLTKDGRYTVTIPRLGLIPGKYWLDVTLETRTGLPVDYYKQALEFEVISGITDVGVYRPEHEWKLEV